MLLKGSRTVNKQHTNNIFVVEHVCKRPWLIKLLSFFVPNCQYFATDESNHAMSPVQLVADQLKSNTSL